MKVRVGLDLAWEGLHSDLGRCPSGIHLQHHELSGDPIPAVGYRSHLMAEATVDKARLADVDSQGGAGVLAVPLGSLPLPLLGDVIDAVHATEGSGRRLSPRAHLQ